MPRMVFLCTILSQFLLAGCQTFLTNQAADLQRVRPLLHLADAHIIQGNLTKALPLVIQAEAMAPNTESVQLKRAQILELQGDVAHAARLYDRLDQKSPAVSLAYATFLRDSGELYQALDVIAVACESVDFVNRYEALQIRASLLIDAGQFDAAASDLSKLAQMKKDNSEIQLLRVEVELKRGSIAYAANLYQALSPAHKMTAQARRIEKEFQRIREQLKIVGRDFGPNNF
jgi:Tfp pilus assembly protein PilF